ncbi:MAG: saccharopine dehydrogenase [Citromicrobium sp.]|nr:MAG: saccharopine dehydrogenase [Citromicrobium sp.]
MLGGYGGFGGRISRRLSDAGHEVVVAGRSLAKAQAFCAGDPGLLPAKLDRSDIAAGLALHRPALVVDASGPFQSMDYSVPRAAIAAGVHYCDIADGSAFVTGITDLDHAARAAGVVVLSGASSVPALSGAVARELAAGLDTVTAVKLAISASNQATAGGSVAAAIIGQVGQPFRLWRGRRRETVHGWQEMERADFALPGRDPLIGRRVALVDVPDVHLLSDRLPGRPSVVFRAGGELGFQNVALWLLSWPVRCRWLKGLSGLARWLRPLQGLTRRMGSDRSGMIVRMFGRARGERVERRWTLIAENGDGPEIPTLAIAPIAARILAGLETAGARDAGEALSLTDFTAAFDNLAVHHWREEFALLPSLYARVMGGRFDRLPSAVRSMHDVISDGGAEGEVEVAGPTNVVGGLIARVVDFPRAGRYPLHVTFAESEQTERWTRWFGTTRFTSELSEADGHLVERFGPARFQFDLPGDEAGLAMVMRRWSLFGIPLPLALAPRSLAREWEEDGAFHFDVPITLPLVGRVVHYRGVLRLV